MDLKTFIHQKRLEKGLTMRELADYVGVSEATISRWESGEIATMKLNAIKKVAAILDIPTEIIFDDSMPLLQPPPSNISENQKKLIKVTNDFIDTEFKELFKTVDYIKFKRKN